MTSESSLVDQAVVRHPLAELRAERGLSREALARLAGVSARTIYGIEIVGTRPQPATLHVLSLALKVEDEQIFPDYWGGAVRA
jgi:transcriptional regulator with XRE-family HTH domain